MANFTITTAGDVRVIKFEDSQIMDEVYAQKVGVRLIQIVDDMVEDKLLLNMAKVKFVASAMIGQLVLLRNKCNKAGIKLAVCELNESICEAIRLMRIDQILEVYETEADAILNLGNTAAS